MAFLTIKEFAEKLNFSASELLKHIDTMQDNGSFLMFGCYYYDEDKGLIGEDDQKEIISYLKKIKKYKSIASNNSEKSTENIKMANDIDVLSETKSKLALLYEYEKHYLELIKTYKEEIKFAASLQEDLRRERSQFFTQTLREVTQTLQTQEVDKKVASQWIEELVASYTKSIDLSSDLAKTHVVQVLNIFKEEAKREVSKAKLDTFPSGDSN